MKNTLTISITKFYTLKSTAETMDVAFDEYLNSAPVKLKYLDMTVEPVAFNVWIPNHRHPKHVTQALKLINKPKEKNEHR